MSSMGLSKMAVAVTRAIRPTMAKRPLTISASSVRPNFKAGKYPKGELFRSTIRSYSGWLGSNNRESPNGRGQMVARRERAKKWALAIKMMARPLVMVSFPEIVARVPHWLKSRGISASGINPCPLQ